MKNYSLKERNLKHAPNVLITGSDGQLGNALRAHPAVGEFQITACGRSNMDITSAASINNAILQFSPDFIINTAAYTAVDKAEKEAELAMSINHIGAKYLAIACKKNQIPLIHLSTDYIFDGTKTSPYLEDDAATPVNLYGESKWLGEQAVREQCEQHIILRVSGVFSEYGSNFMKTILRLAAERKELNIVADQITCPTYAGNIASVIYSIIKKQTHKWGTYHYCDSPPVSWHQFADAIIHQAKPHHALIVEKINAITTAEYPTLAKRPAYSVLDCSKIKKEYGIQQTEWMSAFNIIRD